MGDDILKRILAFIKDNNLTATAVDKFIEIQFNLPTAVRLPYLALSESLIKNLLSLIEELTEKTHKSLDLRAERERLIDFIKNELVYINSTSLTNSPHARGFNEACAKILETIND